MAYASDGAASSVGDLLVVVPLTVAFVAGPRQTLACALAAVLVYILIAAERSGDRSAGTILAQALVYIWPGAFAVVISSTRQESTLRLVQLAEERRRLLQEVQGAEQRERRRLAYELHDEAIQSVLTAQLRLPRAEQGDSAASRDVREGLDQTVRQLRRTISELRSDVFDRRGLAAALRDLAESLQQRTGVRIQVDIADEPENDAETLFLVARELLTNATRHAHATEVTLRLSAGANMTSLVVEDDGTGLVPGRREQALSEGHIGLASCAERIQALGGNFRLTASPAGGLRADALLPKVV